MGSRIQKIINKLEAELELAEEYADSERESTADKYADVPDMIQAAIDALQEVVDHLAQ